MAEHMFAVLVEPAFYRDEVADIAMLPSVWGQMPQDVVYRVLLFLPKSSQCRCCCVSKLWSEMITSKAFQRQSAAVAIRQGGDKHLCTLHFRRGLERATQLLRYKVHDMTFPGLILPTDTPPRVFTHTGLAVIGVGIMKAKAVRFWLLDLVKQTWRELPGIAAAPYAVGSWTGWMLPLEEPGQVKVVVMRRCLNLNLAYYHCYTSLSDKWTFAGVCHTQDGCRVWTVGDNRKMLLSLPLRTGSEQRVAQYWWKDDYVTRLPELPKSYGDNWAVMSSHGNNEFAFAMPLSDDDEGVAVRLYKLIETTQEWTVIYAAQVGCASPPWYVHKIVFQFIGNVVVIMLWGKSSDTDKQFTSRIMVYHMLLDKVIWINEPYWRNYEEALWEFAALPLSAFLEI